MLFDASREPISGAPRLLNITLKFPFDFASQFITFFIFLPIISIQFPIKNQDVRTGIFYNVNFNVY